MILNLLAPARRHRGHAAGAALLAAVLLGASAVPAAGQEPAVTTGDWAGYAAHSTTYDSVTAAWVEPAVSCGSSDSYAAFWVGLDGYNDSSVEQAGTEADCAGGTVRHYAWYELYPAAPVYYSGSVSPGDSMASTVTATAADKFTLTVQDATKGWTFTATKVSSGATRTSAEVIVEAPASSSGTVKSSTVTFNKAYVNGLTLAASHPTGINIGTGDPRCGPISAAGTSFTCTW